jgi:cytochrome c peroxidase
MPARADASHRVSGHPSAVALGERLFASPSLSGTGSVACASCHARWRRFTDGRALAFGLQTGERNTPTVLNVARQRRFGWDGASDALWVQSLRPLRDAREMRSSAAHVAGAFRDALVARDRVAAGAYPLPAQRGLRLFIGKAACATCHAGPLFSDGRLHRTQLGGDRAWRTPGLREVAATGPYMHDARMVNLCDALRPHAGGATAVSLTRAERSDLLAFLKTLGDAEAPFADAQNLRCQR